MILLKKNIFTYEKIVRVYVWDDDNSFIKTLPLIFKHNP